MTGRILVTVACAVAALCAVASSPARTFDGASVRVEYSLGYTTPQALRAAVGTGVDSRIRALRIARVRLAPEDASDRAGNTGRGFIVATGSISCAGPS